MEQLNRYDVVFLFDITDGNPNGDPEMGNMPRVDPEDGCGIVSDVCIKRKIRNFVSLTKNDVDPYRILIKSGNILNVMQKEAVTQVTANFAGKVKTAAERESKLRQLAKEYMCKHYFDVRTFGAVMSTTENAGVVTGPVQVTFSRSVDPVKVTSASITRCCVTREEDLDKNGNQKENTMGSKYIIPYGLYVGKLFVNPFLAEKTGFTKDDLEVLFQALNNLFEFDRTASRSNMAMRDAFVFKHNSQLGNAKSADLFSMISINKKADIVFPRKFEDYEIKVDKTKLPDGVTLTNLNI